MKLRALTIVAIGAASRPRGRTRRHAFAAVA
jgi:hypothetical protein